jgi:hypothetical protein
MVSSWSGVSAIGGSGYPVRSEAKGKAYSQAGGGSSARQVVDIRPEGLDVAKGFVVKR